MREVGDTRADVGFFVAPSDCFSGSKSNDVRSFSSASGVGIPYDAEDDACEVNRRSDNEGRDPREVDPEVCVDESRSALLPPADLLEKVRVKKPLPEDKEETLPVALTFAMAVVADDGCFAAVTEGCDSLVFISAPVSDRGFEDCVDVELVLPDDAEINSVSVAERPNRVLLVNREDRLACEELAALAVSV